MTETEPKISKVMHTRMTTEREKSVRISNSISSTEIHSKENTLKPKLSVREKLDIVSHSYIIDRKIPLSVKRKRALSTVDPKFEEEEQQLLTSDISGETLYLSQKDDYSRSLSIHTVNFPRSWPSQCDFLNDSDIYPKASETSTRIDNITQLSQNESRLLSEDRLTREKSRVFQQNKAYSESKMSSRLLMELTKKQESSFSVLPPKALLKDEEGKPIKELNELGEEFDGVSPIDVENELPVTKERNKFKEKYPSLKEVIRLPIKTTMIGSIAFREILLISCDFSEEVDMNLPRDKTKRLSKSAMLLDSTKSIEVGGMCLSVECTNKGEDLMTFCSTQFSCNGSAGASRLTGSCDRDFALIEERKTEWNCTSQGKIEKCLHVVHDEDQYIAFRSELENDVINRYRGELDESIGKDIINDGALFPLLRYLVITNFSGKFEACCLHISGEICRCLFDVGKKVSININGVPSTTIRVQKTLISKYRSPDISRSYFLATGHLVRQHWLGCRYFIHLNPMQQIPPIKPYHLTLEHNWKDDIILVSKYLEEKQTVNSELITYINDNREIKDTFQDYLLCLLQLKPESVVEFTLEYFQNLYRERMDLFQIDEKCEEEFEEEEEEEEEDECEDVEKDI